MARNLDTLEDALWEEFEAARQRQPEYVDPAKSNESSSSYASPGNFKIENRKAIAELAHAIVAVRREKRVEKFLDSQQRIEEEIDAGISRDVSVLPKVKLKPPG